MCVCMCVSVRGELECVWGGREMCVWNVCVCMCVWQGNVCVECVCVCVRQGNVYVCTEHVHVHGGETKRGSAQNSTANDPILRCIID